MLPYLILFFALIIAFIAYKYYRFKRTHICTTGYSLPKFLRFWFKRLPQNSNWKNFVRGEGTFQNSPTPFSENQGVHGGGTSGKW